ncbi:hypothetical protein SAMN02745126_05984 [Enhydrobacter aerosaccus]|uniref:Uncharacterized protein n=1 Tax=Enhydrobacter aerosaccus TaxID=225324 RepID=A0A1T4TCR9_9HYPH|nr:hypothetical protein [Enhydrobacter aerosaccus]SKA37948.1 hypothetical protein SAMN02745126_05984 [Enhydrobacter aerosaccus]
MDWRPPPKMPGSYWKIRRVGQVISAIFILSIFATAYFQNTYIHYPTRPEPADGKIVGVLIKGSVHYITHQEWLYTRWAFDTSIVSGVLIALILAVIYLRYGKDGFRRDLMK